MRAWTPLALLLTATLLGQTIPSTEGETLSGKKIVLRNELAAQNALLNIGFSRAGGDSSKRWDVELRRNLREEKDLRIFSLAELEDAPKLVRGLIKHGIRSGFPKSEHESFILLYQDADAWKKAADFSAADDAYILLTDSTGRVLWRTHGKAPDRDSLSALRSELGKLREH